jgi:hypothetical protein
MKTRDMRGGRAVANRRQVRDAMQQMPDRITPVLAAKIRAALFALAARGKEGAKREDAGEPFTPYPKS